jgi:hypothetical protein
MGRVGPSHRTFLFGNGLSLAFNFDHYLLQNLTERVRERLKGMADGDQTLLAQLDGIAEALRQDAPQRAQVASFEELAGPVDRLANTLSAFGPLHRVATPDQREVLGQLNFTLRTLYTRVVGSVLAEVAQHPPAGWGWARMKRVADALVEIARAQRTVDVFCLNYDALLDAAAIGACEGPPRRAFLSDEFRGDDVRRVPVYTPDGNLAEVVALRWRSGAPYNPPGPHLRLHHLHGAATWMAFGNDVWKAKKLDRLRECQLFDAWAGGLERPGEVGAVEPVVLLGDQKERFVRRSPFAENYEAFASAVSEADEIVLAGYSFMDVPINRTIAARRSPEARVVIVNPSRNIEARARTALAIPEGVITVIAEPLPNGLLIALGLNGT